MKIKHIYTYILALAMLSCGVGSEETETENPLTEFSDALNELNEELSENAIIQEIYTISSESAGDFSLGGAIPSSTDTYSVTEETVMTETEEGPYEELVYKVSDDRVDLLQITREYDYETSEYLDLIGEMNIYSDRFQTSNGIGVGSTLAEFMETYPDYEIWYTYISDMYVVETPGLTVQFLLDGNGYKGDYPDGVGEIVDLTAENFNTDTKIVTVRMYKI